MTFTFLHTKIIAFATNITMYMWKTTWSLCTVCLSCSRWSAHIILSYLRWPIFSSYHYRI